MLAILSCQAAFASIVSRPTLVMEFLAPRSAVGALHDRRPFIQQRGGFVGVVTFCP
jgi:hypothetical protein